MPARKSAGIRVFVVKGRHQPQSTALGDAMADDLEPAIGKIFRDEPRPGMQEHTAVSNEREIFQQLREPFLPRTGLVFVVQDK